MIVNNFWQQLAAIRPPRSAGWLSHLKLVPVIPVIDYPMPFFPEAGQPLEDALERSSKHNTWHS